MTSVDVALYFRGVDLNPDHVTELLKTEPTSSRQRGKAFQTSSERTVNPKIGVWHLEIGVDRSVEEDLQRILDSSDGPWSAKSIPGCEEAFIDILVFVSVDDEGDRPFEAVVDAEIIRKVAALGLALQVTIGAVSD